MPRRRSLQMHACLRSTLTSWQLLSIRSSWRCLQFSYTLVPLYGMRILFCIEKIEERTPLVSHRIYCGCIHSGIKKSLSGVMSRIEGCSDTIFLTRVIAGCQNPALKSICLDEPAASIINFAMESLGCEANPSAEVLESLSPLIKRRDLIRAALLASTTSALGPAFSFAQGILSGLTPAARGENGSRSSPILIGKLPF